VCQQQPLTANSLHFLRINAQMHNLDKQKTAQIRIPLCAIITRPMKKTLLLLLIFCSQLNFAQCDDDLLIKMLRGVWVKDTYPSDTIEFSMKLGPEMRFELIMADLRRPQSGTYNYRVLGTTMIVQWLLSSNSFAQTIPFFIDRDKQHITLGNFYRSKTDGQTFKFHKIK